MKMNERDMDELVFLWHEYMNAADDTLTKGAVELKRKLKEFVSGLPDLPKELSNE